jgi:hypothetical protein
MKIDPPIWADGRTARKIDRKFTQMHADPITFLRASACICVHLWSKKSCFVGHEFVRRRTATVFFHYGAGAVAGEIRDNTAEQTNERVICCVPLPGKPVLSPRLSRGGNLSDTTDVLGCVTVGPSTQPCHQQPPQFTIRQQYCEQ